MTQLKTTSHHVPGVARRYPEWLKEQASEAVRKHLAGSEVRALTALKNNCAVVLSPTGEVVNTAILSGRLPDSVRVEMDRGHLETLGMDGDGTPLWMALEEELTNPMPRGYEAATLSKWSSALHAAFEEQGFQLLGLSQAEPKTPVVFYVPHARSSGTELTKLESLPPLKVVGFRSWPKDQFGEPAEFGDWQIDRLGNQSIIAKRLPAEARADLRKLADATGVNVSFMLPSRIRQLGRWASDVAPLHSIEVTGNPVLVEAFVNQFNANLRRPPSKSVKTLAAPLALQSAFHHIEFSDWAKDRKGNQTMTVTGLSQEARADLQSLASAAGVKLALKEAARTARFWRSDVDQAVQTVEVTGDPSLVQAFVDRFNSNHRSPPSKVLGELEKRVASKVTPETTAQLTRVVNQALTSHHKVARTFDADRDNFNARQIATVELPEILNVFLDSAHDGEANLVAQLTLIEGALTRIESAWALNSTRTQTQLGEFLNQKYGDPAALDWR